MKPWQTHCSDRCRKTAYERTATGRARALRYGHGPRRRLTRRIARLRWARDYFVSGLRDHDDAKIGPPRLTTQRDLRHVRWERLPVAYRKYADSTGLADKRRLLREWRKFWGARIAEVRAERRVTSGG